MIKKIAVVAAAAGGLLLTSGGWAVADSAAHRATDGIPAVVCAGGNQAPVSNICGNTNTYNADVLGDLLSSLSLSTVLDGLGGSGGNN
ncbi:chaplin [Kitasatospora sp. NPDC057015]|uniref:chaplin n=1 Tax=Kitasatospora sp. NPDC057015 TaxID=3346001 RepID=UPI003639F5A8